MSSRYFWKQLCLFHYEYAMNNENHPFLIWVNIATFIPVHDDESCLNCLLLIFEDEVESEWTEKFELLLSWPCSQGHGSLNSFIICQCSIITSKKLWIVRTISKLYTVNLLVFCNNYESYWIMRIIWIRIVSHHRSTMTCRKQSGRYFVFIKGEFWLSTSWAQMKEHEKSKRTSHHWPSCANWFLRYRNSKSYLLPIRMLPFSWF